jgi:DNA-binding transcriptional LysR family regulator
MEMQSLKAFIAVADSGSFSRAAETLFITQPAVSKRIAALESSLGTVLFDRIGKRVQLTEAGTALLPSGRRVLEQLDEGLRAISNLQSTPRGRLSLATSHHIGLHRLPAVLREFTRHYAEVELDVHFMDSEHASVAIHKGEVELAIVTLPAQPHASLQHITLWSDPMHCVVAKQHALTRLARVTRAELYEYPAILQNSGTHTRKLVDAALGKQPDKILLETGYLETIKAMVQAGLGWSLLPDSMQDSSLRVLDISKLKIDRHLGVILHPGRTRSSAANAMLQLLTNG